MKLPEYVMKCPLCGGHGQYEQTYNAGCGGGLYRSMGRCDNCTPEGPPYYHTGVGFVYKHDGRPVPSSVIAQIRTMNGLEA